MLDKAVEFVYGFLREWIVKEISTRKLGISSPKTTSGGLNSEQTYIEYRKLSKFVLCLLNPAKFIYAV